MTTNNWAKKEIRARLAGVLTVAAILLGGRIPAVAAQDLVGTRSTGMGGTLRATATGESAVLLNPAGMTLTRTYVLSALYQYRASDEASQLNGTVVDSVTSTLAAGLFYSFSHATPSRTLALTSEKALDLEETLETHEAGLSLAYPIASLVHVGLTTKYIHFSVDQPDQTPAEFAVEDISSVTMDVGAIIKPFAGLHIGIVGYNLIPLESTAFPLALGLGLSYVYQAFLVAEFDAVLDFSREETVKASYHGGLEVFLAKMVALRGGAMHDTIREATYVTGGAGLIIRKIAIDFGLRQMVDGGDETLAAFSLRLFVQ